MAGDFDEHLENKFKDDWEVELPPELQSQHRPAPSDGDAKMEDPEVEHGDEQKKEQKVEPEAVDELQVDSTNHKEPEIERKVEHKVMAVCRPRRSTKPVSYEEKSEDELA